MSVKVSSKYQVVIPEAVRDSLGLRPGTQVDVIAKGGVAFIVPVRSISEMKKLFSDRTNGSETELLREKKDRF